MSGVVHEGAREDRVDIVAGPVVCGAAESMCVCGLEPDHGGAHECQCGGSWTFDADGRFVIVAYPGGMR